jgi:hypothetical protein
VGLDPGHFLLPRAKETNPERSLGQISPSTPPLASVRQAQIPSKPSFSGMEMPICPKIKIRLRCAEMRSGDIR